MLLASFSNFMGQSASAIIIELIGGSLMCYTLFSYIKNINVKSQLAAKDTVIETNQQTIVSYGERLDSLEAQVKTLKKENHFLKTELTNWEEKYRSLESFAAPQLGEKLIKMFEQQ
jgi:predicted RNase H-like nuclease (RuvC/YqgF family)